MDRARKMKLAFIAAVACLAAGCGGSGWIVPPSGGGEGVANVSVSATIIYKVIGYENLSISKDATATGGAGSGMSGWDEEAMAIYESTGGICDFAIEHFTSPNSYLEVFDSRTGLNCAEHGGYPERCLDCTVALSEGNCRLDCEGYSTMDAEAAAESIIITADNVSTFKAMPGSDVGALGIKTTISSWPEADLNSTVDSEESRGIDLDYCSGGNDIIKADPADSESFEDVFTREWRYLVTVTDLGKDTDGDGLTICLIRNWVKTTISLADVESKETLRIERGPVRFISKAYADPSDCSW